MEGGAWMWPDHLLQRPKRTCDSGSVDTQEKVIQK